MSSELIPNEAPKAEEVASPPLAPGPSVEDMAARDYMEMLPKFEKHAELLHFSQLRRVFTAIVEYPFANTSPHFVDKAERELFNLCMSLFDCKFVLQRKVLSLKEDEIKELMHQTKENENVGKS